jgi:hypothetical protein
VLIIGLTGAKSAGKTTAWNIIKERFPGAYEITLAKKLKDVCSLVSEVPRDWFDRQDRKEEFLDMPFYLSLERLLTIMSHYGADQVGLSSLRPHIGKVLFTPRQIAQYIGTEVLRAWYPDVHCDHALQSFLQSQASIGVITDIRFKSEVDFFRNRYPNEMSLLYIKNSEAEAKSETDSHASEKGFLQIKSQAYRIVNESSIDNLKQQIYNLLNQLGV